MSVVVVLRIASGPLLAHCCAKEKQNTKDRFQFVSVCVCVWDSLCVCVVCLLCAVLWFRLQGKLIKSQKVPTFHIGISALCLCVCVYLAACGCVCECVWECP